MSRSSSPQKRKLNPRLNPSASVPTKSQASYCDVQQHMAPSQEQLNTSAPAKARPSFQASDTPFSLATAESQHTNSISRLGSRPIPPIIPEQHIPMCTSATSTIVDDATSLPERNLYTDLILQPDLSPISQDELAAEVKGIYAGLVMVEAKCINIDAAQAADPKFQLSDEQWQALIALHRTLMYEHDDFLVATTRSLPAPTLPGLAAKYRRWLPALRGFAAKHSRWRDTQDYMLAFIYSAYQMMALLFEIASCFTDTCIGCLGDLARYRMAIEEKKETHDTWREITSCWWTMVSDRHPKIGRLYDYLGILERPGLRKPPNSGLKRAGAALTRQTMSILCSAIMLQSLPLAKAQSAQQVHSNRIPPDDVLEHWFKLSWNSSQLAVLIAVILVGIIWAMVLKFRRVRAKSTYSLPSAAVFSVLFWGISTTEPEEKYLARILLALYAIFLADNLTRLSSSLRRAQRFFWFLLFTSIGLTIAGTSYVSKNDPGEHLGIGGIVKQAIYQAPFWTVISTLVLSKLEEPDDVLPRWEDVRTTKNRVVDETPRQTRPAAP